MESSLRPPDGVEETSSNYCQRIFLGFSLPCLSLFFLSLEVKKCFHTLLWKSINLESGIQREKLNLRKILSCWIASPIFWKTFPMFSNSLMCVWNIWVWSAVIFSMFFMAMSKNEGKLNWNEGELFHQLFVNSVKMLDAPKDLESKSWMLLNWK